MKYKLYMIEEYDLPFHLIREFVAEFVTNRFSLKWSENSQFVRLQIFRGIGIEYTLLFRRDVERMCLVLPKGNLKVIHSEFIDALEKIIKKFEMNVTLYDVDDITNENKLIKIIKNGIELKEEELYLNETAVQLEIDYKLSEMYESIEKKDSEKIKSLEIELKELVKMSKFYKL